MKTLEEMIKKVRKEPVIYDAFLQTQEQQNFCKIEKIVQKICDYERKKRGEK